MANQIENDIAAIKTEVGKIKTWVSLHAWIWYVVAFGGGYLTKWVL